MTSAYPAVQLLPPSAAEVEARLGARPTVYVTQETTLNVAPAAEFGDLRVLLPRQFQLLLEPTRGVALLSAALAGFGPLDYLLPVGDPLVIAAAAALAAQVSPRVQLLKWDQQERRYYRCALALGDAP